MTTLKTALKTLNPNAQVGIYDSDDEYILMMYIYHNPEEALTLLSEEILNQPIVGDVEEEPDGLFTICYQA